MTTVVLTCLGSSSPQYSITDLNCKLFTFKICEEIAQKSDSGRKALIDDGILPVLLRLATSCTGSYVISACKIINALAYSGTYREVLVDAGAKKVVERITRRVFYISGKMKASLIEVSSLFYPSTLTNARDKGMAKDAAKQAIKTFKATKLVLSPCRVNEMY